MRGVRAGPQGAGRSPSCCCAGRRAGSGSRRRGSTAAAAPARGHARPRGGRTRSDAGRRARAGRLAAAPRRRPAAAPVAAAAGTAVLGPRGAPPVAAPPPPSPRVTPADEEPGRQALPLAVRILAWVIAIPVGLAIVGIPARKLGYLTSQKLLDVFVKHTLNRFVPLAVIVVLWALATTVLVELFVEGGRWIMLRRRRARAAQPPAATGAPASATSDAPPRRRRSAAPGR